jgi:hypothetical protein
VCFSKCPRGEAKCGVPYPGIERYWSGPRGNYAWSLWLFIVTY